MGYQPPTIVSARLIDSSSNPLLGGHSYISHHHQSSDLHRHLQEYRNHATTSGSPTNVSGGGNMMMQGGGGHSTHSPEQVGEARSISSPVTPSSSMLTRTLQVGRLPAFTGSSTQHQQRSSRQSNDARFYHATQNLMQDGTAGHRSVLYHTGESGMHPITHSMPPPLDSVITSAHALSSPTVSVLQQHSSSNNHGLVSSIGTGVIENASRIVAPGQNQNQNDHHQHQNEHHHHSPHMNQ